MAFPPHPSVPMSDSDSELKNFCTVDPFDFLSLSFALFTLHVIYTIERRGFFFCLFDDRLPFVTRVTLALAMNDLHDLPALLQLHSQCPTAFSQLGLENTFRFISLASKLKNEILLAQPSTHPISKLPAFLPPSITTFLSRCCDISETMVDKCWEVLGPAVWQVSYRRRWLTY